MTPTMYQQACADWGDLAFGAGKWEDPYQRNARFFEEALEFVQAAKLSRTTARDVIRNTHTPFIVEQFLSDSVNFCGGHGMTIPEMQMLLDYTYDRPVGELEQEVGGVMVTLALACHLFNVPYTETTPYRSLVPIIGSGRIMKCAERELTRIMDPTVIEKIRMKHRSKPPAGPLPGTAPYAEEPQDC